MPLEFLTYVHKQFMQRFFQIVNHSKSAGFCRGFRAICSSSGDSRSTGSAACAEAQSKTNAAVRSVRGRRNWSPGVRGGSLGGSASLVRDKSRAFDLLVHTALDRVVEAGTFSRHPVGVGDLGLDANRELVARTARKSGALRVVRDEFEFRGGPLSGLPARSRKANNRGGETPVLNSVTASGGCVDQAAGRAIHTHRIMAGRPGFMPSIEFGRPELGKTITLVQN